MDFADKAAELEMAERENALRLARRQQGAGVSRSECFECDEPIPVERQRVVPGVRRCFECQVAHEKQMTGYCRR